MICLRHLCTKKFIFTLSHHSPLKLFTMSYYAVAKGRTPGIYMTWNECKAQVDKFSGAAYKKFNTADEAKSFILERGGAVPSGGKERTEKKSSRFQPYSTTPRSNKLKAATKSENLTMRRNSQGFLIDSEGRVEIFTDGACSNNGYRGAKAGYGVFFNDDHPANVARPVRGRPTNNNAEIQAVTEAARISKKYGLIKIRINTDSEFLINCITKWMPAWKRKGWKTATNQPVINKEELIEMEAALQGLDVQFNHVRGHAGIHGNEKADELARLGAEYYEA